MSKSPTEVAIFKKHFEPITLECATSTLNTLSIKFFNSFNWGLFWLFINHGINFQSSPLSSPDSLFNDKNKEKKALYTHLFNLKYYLWFLLKRAQCSMKISWID